MVGASMTKYLSLVVFLSACGGRGGAGRVEFSITGTEAATTAFSAADGWSVTFKKFFVIVKDVTMTDESGKVVFKQPTGLLYDLTRAADFPVQSATGVAAGHYAVGYEVGFDPSFQIVNMNAAASPDASLMRNNEWGLYAEGHATKGTQEKTFSWGFSNSTAYQQCAGGLDVTGATLPVSLTIRPKGLLSTVLTDENSVSFEAIASADSPVDGSITLEELAKVQVTGTSYASQGANTLREFVESARHTLGYLNGSGTCVTNLK